MIFFAAFNACIIKTTLHFVSERYAKSEGGKFRSLQKVPQNKLGYRENYGSFVIPIHVSTDAEMSMKFGPVLAEIFIKICRFLPSRPKRYRNSIHNLWG